MKEYITKDDLFEIYEMNKMIMNVSIPDINNLETIKRTVCYRILTEIMYSLSGYHTFSYENTVFIYRDEPINLPYIYNLYSLNIIDRKDVQSEFTTYEILLFKGITETLKINKNNGILLNSDECLYIINLILRNPYIRSLGIMRTGRNIIKLPERFKKDKNDDNTARLVYTVCPKCNTADYHERFQTLINKDFSPANTGICIDNNKFINTLHLKCRFCNHKWTIRPKYLGNE